MYIRPHRRDCRDVRCIQGGTVVIRVMHQLFGGHDEAGRALLVQRDRMEVVDDGIGCVLFAVVCFFGFGLCLLVQPIGRRQNAQQGQERQPGTRARRDRHTKY